MSVNDPVFHIKELCAERDWSYYQLAKSSGLSYSTISTLLNNNNLPSLTTLEKICSGFGISLADFFDPGRDLKHMSEEQQAMPEDFQFPPGRQKAIGNRLYERLEGRAVICGSLPYAAPLS